ncbi:MAG: hypothetical protein RLY14_2033 [Planctomycetota bacterium]|jgi:hypothetical protein
MKLADRIELQVTNDAMEVVRAFAGSLLKRPSFKPNWNTWLPQAVKGEFLTGVGSGRHAR